MNRKGDRSAVAWRTGAAENDADLGQRLEAQQIAHPPASEPETLSAPKRPAGRQRKSAFSPRMRKIPVAAALRKMWIVLVIVVVVAVAAFCVLRLRTFFGVPDNRPITSGSADDIKPFNPKHVVYEVYGPPGTVANINYLDINAQPQKASNVPLPWTLSVITTLPSVSVNVVAQANTDQIGCRIIVNDVVKDERSASGMNAQTFCIVKSA
jgi:hypothetical protein